MPNHRHAVNIGLNVAGMVLPMLVGVLTVPGLISAPAAFTRTTGQSHWDLLLRTRAVENLAFVIAPAQCGRHPGGKETYGHSMIVDPWGVVLDRLPRGSGVVIATINPEYQQRLRASLPALQHRRL